MWSNFDLLLNMTNIIPIWSYLEDEYDYTLILSWGASLCPRPQSVSIHQKLFCREGQLRIQNHSEIMICSIKPTFPIASLNRYSRNFSGVPQKLTWCQQFGLQIFQKWGDAEKPPQKTLFLGVFFWRNKFSRPNGRLSPIACHTYLESYGT